MESTPGIKTSEGVTAIVAVLTPLAAAIGKLEGWPLVAALGVAGLVASVYIGARTWLKGRGGAAAALLLLSLTSLSGCSGRDGDALATAGALVLLVGALLGAWSVMRARANPMALLLVLLLASPSCAASNKQIAATATIATVQTLDEGLKRFHEWSVGEEDQIITDAIDACRDKRQAAAYLACTKPIVAARRAPIDKARKAIDVYRAALAGGDKLAQRDLEVTARSVIEALAAVGIRIAGGVL